MTQAMPSTESVKRRYDARCGDHGDQIARLFLSARQQGHSHERLRLIDRS